MRAWHGIVLLLLIGCGKDGDDAPAAAAPVAVPIGGGSDPLQLFGEGDLVLVDEVLGSEGAGGAHELYEDPAGSSTVQTILGQNCRVIPNTGGARAFAYRIGKNKGLVAGTAYVLSIEYPEDQPRTVWVVNRGAETNRGFHTGSTVGDVLHGTYVHTSPESRDIPLQGGFQEWRQYFHLHHKTAGIKKDRWTTPRPNTPADGFWVILLQSKDLNQPKSAGVAVSRIRLYEVADPSKHNLTLSLPPAGLPRRHIFWREEMSDDVVDNPESGTPDDQTWYEYKARLMKFLGVDTFCKDLLEFGHNQGWVVNPDNPWDSSWYNTNPNASRWSEIVAIAAQYGLNVLPYYEYAGSIGQDPNVAIGTQKRCQPLAGPGDYTDLWWTNLANCDVTDPDFVTDVKKRLDRTVVPHKAQANFLGAMFRVRLSMWPISFSDATRQRFANEANGGVPVSRANLQSNAALLQQYYAWWFQKRRAFAQSIRDYLASHLGAEAALLVNLDYTEGSAQIPGSRYVVTDDTAFWTPRMELPEHRQGAWYTVYDWATVVQNQSHLAGLKAWLGAWGGWEWNHAAPPYDPESWQATPGLYLTYSFSKTYSVANPASMDAFRGPGGLAMVRNYSLNEDEMEDRTGYFVSDMNRTGPFEMIEEAYAMAYGDPRFLGYLSSNNYTRGFPQYVRAFNAAFLSLPALPSVVIASPHPDVVIRKIVTPSHGTWYAMVNVGLVERTVTLDLGAMKNAVTGEALSSTLTFYPCELKSIHVAP